MFVAVIFDRMRTVRRERKTVLHKWNDINEMYVIDLLIFLFSVCTRDLMLYQLFCLPPDTKCVQADEITRCVYMRRPNKFVENGYYHILLLDSTQAHTDTIPYLRTNYSILAFPFPLLSFSSATRILFSLQYSFKA